MPGSNANRTIQIPAWFLTDVAPEIREMAELQVMLAVFRHLEGVQRLDEPVPVISLLQDPVLIEALRLDGAVQPPDVQIRRGIELATARDILLEFTVTADDHTVSQWILVATPENRIKLERYRSGELDPPVTGNTTQGAASVERSRPGIFKLYEQNIGLVTPIIADRLVEAMELYPQSWIEDAIEAAVSYNRRNWRYIQRILETWATEGRSHETNRRHQSSTDEIDPERHLSGEYAAIFRRRRRE